MSDEITNVSINFSTDGKARVIYKDELLPLYSELGDMKVARASNVEWEEIDEAQGWSVRAAHDPELAIRIILDGGYRKVVSRQGEIALFVTREAALESELNFFWELLPPREK